MRANAWMGLVFALLVAGCAHLGGDSRPESVLQADRDFAARAARVGLAVAFVEYAAPDATLFRAGVGPIKGHAAIGASFAGTEKATLEWSPEAAEVASGSDLAYTWGWYTFTAEGKSSTGNYVTVWRRVDGRWRWVIDLGVPAPRPR